MMSVSICMFFMVLSWTSEQCFVFRIYKSYVEFQCADNIVSGLLAFIGAKTLPVIS